MENEIFILFISKNILSAANRQQYEIRADGVE